MKEDPRADVEREIARQREVLANYEREVGRLKAKVDSLEDEAVSHAHFHRQGFDPDACAAGLPDLFERIVEDMRGRTFDDLFQRWTRNTPNLPGQARNGSLSVIPGNSETPPCNPLVVVFVPSGMHRYIHGGSLSYDPIEALKIHLVTCRLVRGVIFVFEWGAVSGFDDSLRQWIRAWKSQGIAFAIGVCGPGGSCIQPFPTGV